MGMEPELKAHHEWLGLLQPVGVVVSPPALLAAQAYVNRSVGELRAKFDGLALPARQEPGAPRKLAKNLPVHLRDFERFVEVVLGWDASTDLVPQKELPESLRVPLPDYGEELAPTWAVAVGHDAEVEDTKAGNAGRWLLLVQQLPRGWDLDEDHGDKSNTHRWHAPPQKRFERLLRETGVPIGLLFNETSLRLVYQPSGESSGHLTFPVALMCETQGAPALAALHMLLAADRLFSVPTNQRLPNILRESRKYQNQVSAALAQQVLDALWELLRGFQSAHSASGEQLLRAELAEDREAIYGALLTVLLRLVFVLFAEDQGLIPAHPVYAQNYSVRGLYEKLRDEAGRHHDTIDQQYGAWGRLASLFRFVYEGGQHGTLKLPPRYGRLFDPDAYPFLEGRPYGTKRAKGEVIELPKVSNGVVYRVLERLMVLDGEALSYRTLDVEELGGVYQELMGFTVEIAAGPSVALTPDDVVVDLAELLKSKDERAKSLAKKAGCELTGATAEKVKAAKTVAQLVEALGRKISSRTPEVVQAGGMFLQPTEERRRSGTHYTPRTLTEPIVRTTLRPVLEGLAASAPSREGRAPTATPAQILGLKVCDPAMGSGAFLVAACRHLAESLVKGWEVHGERPTIPADEDEVLHARRLVAQHCLYGVDKNPFAVDLAKLSLWLATMAREHPFTFLDPVLKQGDSLVGLTQNQIETFDWSTDPKKKRSLDVLLWGKVREAEKYRLQIQALAGSDDTGEKRRLHLDAEHALADARLVGDLVVEAFFGAEKDKERKARLGKRYEGVTGWRNGTLERAELAGLAKGLRERAQPVWPFHWAVEFPEVFLRENPGFDACVGNPPFMGGTKTTTALGTGYRDWLAIDFTSESGNSNADLVAHFFRRAFSLLGFGKCLGMVATNSIAQGDTRETGLSWIRENDGWIFGATRRHPWPGMAAVVVSIVNIIRGSRRIAPVLNGLPVSEISAFLFPGSTDRSPPLLCANKDIALRGNDVFGSGFLFDDYTAGASPISDMDRLLKTVRNGQRIKPYLTGEDINTSPVQLPSRSIIDFATMTEAQAREWPELFSIVEDRVKPARANVTQRDRRELWWLYATRAPRYRLYMETHSRFIAISMVSSHIAFAFVVGSPVISNTLVAFGLSSDNAFAILQSRVHEFWARFFGSSMKDDLRYTPSDCFETFPFPRGWESNARLEAIGKEYYDFRAKLMVDNNEGLTKTYNRFHDPNERDPRITHLRALHDAMDRAVLDAYGWTDLQPSCAFIAEYEEEEGEGDDGGAKRKKRRPMRYRWPDELRDEVLAKLVELNAVRAKEEGHARQLAKVQRVLGGVEG